MQSPHTSCLHPHSGLITGDAAPGEVRSCVLPARLWRPRLACRFSHVRLSATMDCSTPGLPVHHQLPEFTQTHVHRVSDAIQPSHPLSAPSPPALANSFSFPWACPLWPKERGVCVFRDSIRFLTHTAPRRLGDTRLWREVSSPAGQNPHGYSKRCSPCGALPTPPASM